MVNINAQSDARNYLPKLPYEFSYATTAQTADGIHSNQDALMIDGINRRNLNTSILRAGSQIEGAAFARARLALGNYMDMLTGFPEYLK